MKAIRPFAAVFFLLATSSALGQVSLPHMERIYGGTIRQIDMLLPSSTQTFLVVVAESPRALFYGEVDYSGTEWTNMFSGWTVVPDFEGSENHGIPAQIAVHQPSQRIFVADENEGLLSCGLARGSIATNLPGEFKAVLVTNDVLLAVQVTNDFDELLWYGTLDSAGALTLGADAPLPIETESYVTFAVHPTNGLVYFMRAMNATSFYYSSDAYNALTNTTTFTEVPLPAPLDGWDGGEQRIGFGPDGKLFINGQSNMIVQIGVSTNNGAGFEATDTARQSAGTTMGLNFEPEGVAGDYRMYFGMFVNTNSGAAADWVDLPMGAAETHINMGSIRVDPNDPEILYVTTDQGTGVSTNSGFYIAENNEGLTATHVADIDLADTTKDVVWIATKNGAWFTTNFTTNVVWTDADFPDGIVNSIAIVETDTTYQTVFAGSRRVWKTTTAGAGWTQVYSDLSEDGIPTGIDDGWIEDIETVSNLVFAGYHGYDHLAPGGELAWSDDGGSSWSIIETNLNVTDLLYSYESSTGTLFASAAYFSAGLPYGIYSYVPGVSGFTRIFTNEVTITDLEDNPTGTVFAVGYTTNKMPVVYVAADDFAAWTLLPTNGLPRIESNDGPSDWLGPSLTLGTNAAGQQVIYVALETNVWYLPNTGTNDVWLNTRYMNMMDGSRIHVVVWDDLLVGSGTGLYSLDLDSDGDGISDADETGVYGTDPALADSDADGIDDWEELDTYSTDPLDEDSDNDGAGDGDEVVAGTDPGDSDSVFALVPSPPEAGPPPVGAVFVNWNSAAGKSYDIRKSTNLLDGFSLLDADIGADPPVNVYTDYVAPDSLNFYQIITE